MVNAVREIKTFFQDTESVTIPFDVATANEYFHSHVMV